MTRPLGDWDDYEYRVGYQYTDGRVGHTMPEDEREAIATIERFRARHRGLLLQDPWMERRRIMKWDRWMP